jgi:hypothetical protein
MASIANIFSKNKNKVREEIEMKEKYNNGLVCRFVLDGLGRKIGESVAVNDDLLIIKSGKKYLGVPIKHIEEEGITLLVKGLIEQDKAELMGEKWRLSSHKEIKNLEDE